MTHCRDKGQETCMTGTEFSEDMLRDRLFRGEQGQIRLMLLGMVPPEPALCILHVLETETPLRLTALLDRNPVNLYDALEERGWCAVQSMWESEGFCLVIEPSRP
jgi:hypothetical protein